MSSNEKILVVGPSWVGDMVMSQTLYITLQQQIPGCSIDVLAPAWCKPILERMPQVNQALEMPFSHGEFNLSGRYKLGKKLKKANYTRAYVCPNSAKSALVPWFAGIQVRVGWKGESRYGLLNDLRSNKKDFPLMVERYIALAHDKALMTDASVLGGLESLPKPQLTIDAAAQQSARDKFGLSSSAKVIGLCPGAEFGPAKQWPVEHFAAVAQSMLEQGYQVWLFGSQKDNQTTEAIAELVSRDVRHNLVNLAGRTSLIEAVDLLGACETVVSNDSGLMHVAGAVGCHVIGVYGSTSQHYTPPLARKVDIVHTDIECRPCFKRECPLGHLKCLKELSPSMVLANLPVKSQSTNNQ